MRNSRGKYKSFSTISDRVTPNGILYDMDVVKEDLLNLLLTRKGDFPQNYNLGCILHNYVFDPSLTSYDIEVIKNDLYEQMGHDPRLRNIQINIDSTETEVFIAIAADVYGLDNPLSLVLPMKEIIDGEY